jgi:hypothetical protein
MTHHDDLIFRFERARPFLKTAERQKLRAFDARQLKLFRLAHVNQPHTLAARRALRKLRRRDRLITHILNFTLKRHDGCGGNVEYNVFHRLDARGLRHLGLRERASPRLPEYLFNRIFKVFVHATVHVRDVVRRANGE